MKTLFVDTNIFLRYLTGRDEAKSKACYQIFKKAQTNEVVLVTSEAIIAEIVYVLSSKKHYQLTPDDIKNRLYPVLALPSFKLTHRKIYLRALDTFAQLGIDFEDCLTIAHMEYERIEELLSYDRDFDQVPGITRREP